MYPPGGNENHARLARPRRVSLEARLGFSGNALPEENRTVALTELGLPLGDVPAILLSECYHDLASLAI